GGSRCGLENDGRPDPGLPRRGGGRACVRTPGRGLAPRRAAPARPCRSRRSRSRFHAVDQFPAAPPAGAARRGKRRDPGGGVRPGGDAAAGAAAAVSPAGRGPIRRRGADNRVSGGARDGGERVRPELSAALGDGGVRAQARGLSDTLAPAFGVLSKDERRMTQGGVVMGYGTVARFLHWIMALLILAMIPAGLTMVQEDLPRPVQDALFIFHKNTGSLLLVLVIVRIIWRAFHPAPPLPDHMPVAMRAAARTTHYGLYLAVLTMAVSGYSRVRLGGFP